tara:strand:- start:747 stop:908 length:162 start_codon:yes stop_codon:yes gene_type:complete
MNAVEVWRVVRKVLWDASTDCGRLPKAFREFVVLQHHLLVGKVTYFRTMLMQT